MKIWYEIPYITYKGLAWEVNFNGTWTSKYQPNISYPFPTGFHVFVNVFTGEIIHLTELV
jgi:hypothetical protein